MNTTRGNDGEDRHFALMSFSTSQLQTRMLFVDSKAEQVQECGAGADGVSRSHPYNQMFALPPSTTLTASRLPSGEKRAVPLYSAAVARSGCVWPVLS
jgi:hypothetical protein